MKSPFENWSIPDWDYKLEMRKAYVKRALVLPVLRQRRSFELLTSCKKQESNAGLLFSERKVKFAESCVSKSGDQIKKSNT